MSTWNLTTTKHHVLICNGGSCKREGAELITQAIRNEITAQGLDSLIHTSRTLCNGRCNDKCVVIAYPEGHWYKHVKPEDSSALITSLFTPQSLQQKISHMHNGNHFVLTSDVITGETKPSNN